MSNSQEYKGFSVYYGVIHEGRKKYTGLVARKKGILIESPTHDTRNYSGICKAIDQLSNKEL